MTDDFAEQDWNRSGKPGASPASKPINDAALDFAAEVRGPWCNDATGYSFED